jgi:Na+/glutamate symporter
VIHVLADSESQLFFDAVKLIGGGSVAALLLGIVWAFITGKIVARWSYDEMKTTLTTDRDAQRVRAELAEGSLFKSLMLGDKAASTAEINASAVEKLANHKPPTTADSERKP